MHASLVACLPAKLAPTSPDLYAMPSATPTSLLSRGAVGFWFLGLGVLGLLRGAMRAFRHGAFAADSITWLWLVGSALILLAGAIVVARVVRRGRDSD